MSSIPSNLSRVPNSLARSLSLNNTNRTNVDLLRIQQQISTNRALLRPSDDPIRATTIGVLDDRLERITQLQRNLSHAGTALNLLDNALGEVSSLGLDAKSLASEQMSGTSTASERASQATVIDQMLNSLFNTATRSSDFGFLFGGTQTSGVPVTEFAGGYRFNGIGQRGLVTDLGVASTIPITLGNSPLVGVSGRVQGVVDLNPTLSTSTRLSDLAGGRGLGVTLGAIEFSVSGGDRVSVDLAGSEDIEDVIAKLTSAIQAYETENSTTVLGPGGISVSAEGLSIDVLPGSPSPTISFFEVGTNVTARDLGLAAEPAAPQIVFSSTSASGTSLQPRLTWLTRIDQLAGVTGPLGAIRVNNVGRTATIDLSTATTLQDLRNRIEGANLGVRVELNEDGNGINIINEVSSTSANSLSIEEVPGNNATATRLGIRSFAGTTRISDFNFGKGVSIVDGVRDPVSGNVSTNLNVDMRIILGNGSTPTSGTQLEIDLRPEDMATVDTVLARINSQIQDGLAIAGLPADSLVAEITDGSNGIRLRQSTGFGQPLKVEARNNSLAAEQLGLLGGTYNATSASLEGTDRAKVRVESMFTHLLDLRASLISNNVSGIALAATGIDEVSARVSESRGLVGAYGQRVDAQTVREQDRETLDTTTRSSLRDVDFAEAATRLSALNTQLEATLRVTGLTQGRTLLDYIG